MADLEIIGARVSGEFAAATRRAARHFDLSVSDYVRMALAGFAFNHFDDRRKLAASNRRTLERYRDLAKKISADRDASPDIRRDLAQMEQQMAELEIDAIDAERECDRLREILAGFGLGDKLEGGAE